MNSNIAISVKNLQKTYQIGKSSSGTIMDLFRKNKSFDEFHAIKNVSFDVEQGDVLGIIGKNGAGKSTLLKLLSRITEPTKGRIELHGRVSSLLEVGTGFHPELTGKENIYLNGTILGMKRKEITKKLDEIIAFSGVEKFLYTPVKHYSSGMYVRLAFSVAAHLEPEILIIDEVLAVGDAEFQKKCLGKMNDVAQSGRTVLFVSHNMGTIQNLCTKGMFLKDGELIYSGDVESCIDQYLESHDTNENGEWEANKTIDNIQIGSVKILNKDQKPASHYNNLEEIKISLNFKLLEEIKNLKIGMRVINSKGIEVLTTYHNDIKDFDLAKNETHNLSVDIPAKLLNSGTYYISLDMGIHNERWIINEEKILKFHIDFLTENQNLLQANKRGSVIAPLLEWKTTKQ